MTWLRPRNWRPRFINSATLLPSRMNSSNCVGDERDGFGMIQAQAAREAFLREKTGVVQHQFVDFARR